MYSNVQNLDRTQNQNKLNFAVTLYSEFTRPSCLSVSFQVDRSDLFLLNDNRCHKVQIDMPMEGIDKMDSMIGMFPSKLKVKRWPMSIFFTLLI